jgi:thiamine biosynthesis lipoprotein
MTTKERLSRRDFIKITAVAGGALVGGKLLLDLFDEQRYITLKETRVLMGTIINLAVVAHSQSDAEHAIEATFTELERQIAIFDHRSSDSPVTILNREGVLFDPTTEFLEVLEQASIVSGMTNGAFDVTVKPLIDLYQQSQPDLPGEEEVQGALGLVDYRKLAVSTEKVHCTQPGMQITLDGIAKGFIVDAGVAQLRQLGYDNIFVEAGGDLMASGLKEGEIPWRVGVQSPREGRGVILASFSVRDQAVATSGDYMQYFSQDKSHHHILDPRTGYSAPYIASTTVLAPNCMIADAVATALMVLEPSEGIRILNQTPDVEGMLITKSMEEIKSAGFIWSS